MAEVGGISSSGALQQVNQNQRAQKRKEFEQQFQQLGEALQSGDLSSAQKTFSAIQQNAPQRPQSAQGQGGNDPFAAMANALQSGDLNAAKQAYTQIQQLGGHHHHRQPPAEQTEQAASPQGSVTQIATDLNSNPNASPVGTNLNITG